MPMGVVLSISSRFKSSNFGSVEVQLTRNYVRHLMFPSIVLVQSETEFFAIKLCAQISQPVRLVVVHHMSRLLEPVVLTVLK